MEASLLAGEDNLLTADLSTPKKQQNKTVAFKYSSQFIVKKTIRITVVNKNWKNISLVSFLEELMQQFPCRLGNNAQES